MLAIMRQIIIGPRREKTCLRGFANSTGADQPAHSRSLISAFVICVLKSIICNLASNYILLFWQVSVAEETGLKLALSETPKTNFLATRPISPRYPSSILSCNAWQSQMYSIGHTSVDLASHFDLTACFLRMSTATRAAIVQVNWNYLGQLHRIIPRMYIEVTLTSQKPYQHNGKFDCSETIGYNIPQDAI